MANFNYHDTPDDKRNVATPAPAIYDPGRFKPVDESDWGWVVEVYDKGDWKLIHVPVAKASEAYSKVPAGTNHYRIRGSLELGNILRGMIAKQEEDSRKQKR